MIDGLFVFENFYNNPDEVRNHALSLEMSVQGNYPGSRTESLEKNQRENLKNFFEKHIIRRPITYWPSEYNTAYQYTTAQDTTWIHHDDTTWAGVLYLTPNAPVESGTGIYRHKESGICLWDRFNDKTDYNSHEDSYDLSKWDCILSIGNVYNRLVVYQGAYYHRSILPGFGTNKNNGRLFQTFFFNTE